MLNALMKTVGCFATVFQRVVPQAESTVNQKAVEVHFGAVLLKLSRRQRFTHVTEYRSVCFVQKIGWYRGYSVPYVIFGVWVFLLSKR